MHIQYVMEYTSVYLEVCICESVGVCISLFAGLQPLSLFVCCPSPSISHFFQRMLAFMLKDGIRKENVSASHG